jgi:hypothetical protein
MGQQCTYDDDGKLITETPGAGTPDLVAPWQMVRVTIGNPDGLTMPIPGKGTVTVKGPTFTTTVEQTAPIGIGGHFEHDVLPYHLAESVDAWRGTAPYVHTYFWVRPPNNANHCTKNRG